MSTPSSAPAEVKGDSKSVVESKSDNELRFVTYDGEHQLPMIQSLIEKELSEPYSVFTYRYFVNNWPKLCFLAMLGKTCVGTIVCKLAPSKRNPKRSRGYIAMLAVEKEHRKRKIGTALVRRVITAMTDQKADVIVLETEISNKAALSLYEHLDFVRDKRLHKYYLNGGDAFRLKLWLSPPAEEEWLD